MVRRLIAVVRVVIAVVPAAALCGDAWFLTLCSEQPGSNRSRQTRVPRCDFIVFPLLFL